MTERYVIPMRRPRGRAAKATFDIVELLEQVLLFSTMKDLYLYQRVSKQWYDTIAGSEALQKKMFRLAISAPLRPDGATIWNYGSQVQKVNPECGGVDHHKAQGIWLGPSSFYACTAVDFHIDHTLPDGTIEIKPIGTVFQGHSDNGTYFYNPGYEHATWRTMFLTQPPITALGDLRKRNVWGDDSKDLLLSIHNAKGITLQDVQEWCVKLQSHEYSHLDTGMNSGYARYADQWYMSFQIDVRQDVCRAETQDQRARSEVCSCISKLRRE